MTNSAIKLIEVPCPVCRNSDGEPIATGYDFEYSTSQQDYTLKKCSDCEIVYLSPRPHVSELSKIYPPEYNPFNFHKIKNPIVRWGRNFIQKKKVNFFKKLLPKDANIIDVGCGSGSLLLLMQKFGSQNWKLYGNDFNSESLSNLKQAGIQTLIGRFEQIETELRFDAVILNQAIEHLDCPAEVIRKARKLLKHDGIIIIETPSLEGLDSIIFKKRYWGGYHIPRHWSIFSSESLEKMLRSSGFKKVSVSYMASPSFWIQSFHHYFLDRNYPKWWTNMWVFKNPILLALFTLIDLVTVLFKKPTSNMRATAVRI